MFTAEFNEHVLWISSVCYRRRAPYPFWRWANYTWLLSKYDGENSLAKDAFMSERTWSLVRAQETLLTGLWLRNCVLTSVAGRTCTVPRTTKHSLDCSITVCLALPPQGKWPWALRKTVFSGQRQNFYLYIKPMKETCSLWHVFNGV